MGLTFSDFWLIYPKRKGSNPTTPARTKWDKAIKDGVDPEHIISSAKKYGDELREQDLINTPYVCMASTWLNQKRYLDYAPDPESKERDAKIDADMLIKGYVWDGKRWLKTTPQFEKVMDDAMLYDTALKNLTRR
jgi:hypothetical protein